MGRTPCGRPCSYTRVQQSDAHPRTACLLHVLRLPSILAGGGRSFHPSYSVAANVRCPSSCASTPTSRKEVSPSNEHPHGQQLTTCPSLTDWQAVPLRQEPGSASGWNPWRAVTHSRPHGSGAAARVNIHHWLPQQKGDSHGSTRFYPRDAQRVCSLKSNGHKTRPSWLSRVQEAQRAVPHATADDAVHGAFMTLPRYTYTREDACDALAHRSQDGRVLDSLCLQRSGPNACRVRLCITKCPPELGYT